MLTTHGLDVSLSDLQERSERGKSDSEDKEDGAGALVDNLPIWRIGVMEMSMLPTGLGESLFASTLRLCS